jgi:hypothetical protein
MLLGGGSAMMGGGMNRSLGAGGLMPSGGGVPVWWDDLQRRKRRNPQMGYNQFLFHFFKNRPDLNVDPSYYQQMGQQPQFGSTGFNDWFKGLGQDPLLDVLAPNDRLLRIIHG